VCHSVSLRATGHSTPSRSRCGSGTSYPRSCSPFTSTSFRTIFPGLLDNLTATTPAAVPSRERPQGGANSRSCTQHRQRRRTNARGNVEWPELEQASTRADARLPSGTLVVDQSPQAHQQPATRGGDDSAHGHNSGHGPRSSIRGIDLGTYGRRSARLPPTHTRKAGGGLVQGESSDRRRLAAGDS